MGLLRDLGAAIRVCDSTKEVAIARMLDNPTPDEQKSFKEYSDELRNYYMLRGSFSHHHIQLKDVLPSLVDGTGQMDWKLLKSNPKKIGGLGGLDELKKENATMLKERVKEFEEGYPTRCAEHLYAPDSHAQRLVSELKKEIAQDMKRKGENPDDAALMGERLGDHVKAVLDKAYQKALNTPEDMKKAIIDALGAQTDALRVENEKWQKVKEEAGQQGPQLLSGNEQAAPSASQATLPNTPLNEAKITR